MNENQAKAGATRPPQSRFTTTRRGSVVDRRAAASSRMVREARQRRIAILAVIGVAALVVITLAIGAAWDYVIYPAQAVATVNGAGIRNDEFNRFQKFESFYLNAQINALQSQISQLQADTKHAAQNSAIINLYQQQLTSVQSNASNIPAYTLQQMEQTLELKQHAAQIGITPTKAQLDSQISSLVKQLGGPAGYGQMKGSTGVSEDDLRNWYAMPAAIQANGLAHFQGTVSPTQPWAKARHILVATKTRADQIVASLKEGASFSDLAKHFSLDNGLQAGQTYTPTQKLQLESTSSAFNGGWLRDPSQPFVKNQPTWITPQTSYVKPVLDAILSMKVGEIRVVKSQFGYHVIQVTAHTTHKLSKTEINNLKQQQAQQGYQAWFQSATDASKNKVNPPQPYAQFPSSSSSGQ
ncbi:MAG TPA: peptidylprolyl isomerase [Chloroflexota bacterium]|nr:peptidylprolyl isomerase [Chloroflexota bacterium]